VGGFDGERNRDGGREEMLVECDCASVVVTFSVGGAALDVAGR
jgi:hypothetical protein